jgi:hypothetical protein
MTETTPTRTRTWIRRTTLAATLLATLGLTVVTSATADAAPAGAASATAVTPATISGPHSLTVSCNSTKPKTGVKVVQRNTGTFKVRQNSSTHSSKSVVWAVSSAGNSLPTRTISTGQTATWTNVLHTTYTIHVHRSGTLDCNGLGLQDGNYNWNYTVTYNG